MAAVLTYLEVPAAQLMLVLGSVAAAAVVACWVARQSDAVEEDPLTRLPNRRGVYRRLGDLLASQSRDGGELAVALLDLDHFKTINDTQGHEAGDRVLLDCASAWRRSLPARTVLGRLGGDEFALLMPGLSPLEAFGCVETLRRVTPAAVTISVGVAAWQEGDGRSDLLRRADQALYQAKGAGRARTEVFGAAAAG